MKSQHQYTNEEISRAAQNVRKRALRLVIDGGGGYVGQACSAAEILMTLYMRVLNIGESLGSPNASEFLGAPGRNNKGLPKGSVYHGPVNSEYDRFFISPPQYATAIYPSLIECGRLGSDALEYFGKDGYNLEIIAADHSPGFENMGGSLSQTISVAAGTAHARKLKGESGRVFTFISDGESQEGQTWEAIQTAVFKKLDNLIIYMDVNGQQCEGATKDVLGLDAQNFADRFKAFGAEVVVVDGHDIDALAAAADTPHPDKPLVIVCRTSCTTGIPMLERKRPNLHFIAFGKDELAEIEAFYAKM